MPCMRRGNNYFAMRLCFNQNIFKRLSPACIYRSYSVAKFDFSEQTVVIKTCGNIYNKWKKQNLYRKLPDGDLEFKVPFIDTQHNSKATSLPIVLALHGAPGSWKDFALLTSYLHHRGYRVIAPSFPDFHSCKPGIFRHSDVEKAQYVKDFLKEISVSHVDHLICHSSATYPGLILCLNEAPKIKSLGLLNPGTYHVRLMRSTRNFEMLKILMKTTENPLSLKFVEICGAFIMKKIFKIPIRFESVLDPALSATAMVRGNIAESKEKFLQLASRKLPIFYAFSEVDPLIGTKASYKLAELLGAKLSDIFIYDKGGALIQKGNVLPALRVMAFQEGSHYVFLKHHEIIHRELDNFLRSVLLII